MSDGSHILCCICSQPIPRRKWAKARAWMDPDGIACVAHTECLVYIGEFELGLDVPS